MLSFIQRCCRRLFPVRPKITVARSIYDGLSDEDLRQIRESPAAVSLRAQTKRFREAYNQVNAGRGDRFCG